MVYRAPVMRQMRILLIGAPLALALWDAARRAWVCDDAFISFRYAKNLVEGNGLVFNAGERVEGYTNFLWTMACALGMALGVEPVRFSLALGLACFAATLALLLRVGRQLDGALGPGLPVAALGFAACLHARLFATSGLETCLFTLLSTAALCAAADGRGRWVGVGALATLAALTRPEGLLVVGLCGLAGLAARRPGVLLVPAAVIPAYLAWKFWYFGDLLPNTWYAKAGAGSRWGQGGRYLDLVLGAYPALLVALPASAALWHHRAPGEGWRSIRAAGLFAAFAAAWMVYTVRVGGDFMFARFLLPIFPALLLLVDMALRRLPARAGRLAAVAVVLAMALGQSPAAVRSTAAHPEGAGGVVEESDWYPADWHRAALRKGRILRPFFVGTDAKVVYYGAQAMLMYYAEIPVAIEGHVGLTDREIARLPPPQDQRFGHGKKVGLVYLRERGVDMAFVFRQDMPTSSINRATFPPGILARLLTWRPALVQTLQSRGVEILDVPAFLDDYLGRLDSYDPAAVARTLGELDGFYFTPSGDMARRQKLVDWLTLHGVQPAD